MDSTLIQDGTIIKTLSSKQRDTIKEKFKGFNDQFDEFLKASKSYAVPDQELRAQISQDIKSVLLPMYNRFYDKYQGMFFQVLFFIKKMF